MYRNILLVLAAVGLIVGCSNTKTVFNGNNDTTPGLKENVDVDPKTVGERDSNGEIELPDQPGDPSGFWKPSTGDFVLRDQETGSLWNLRGEAYAGPLAGQRLEQIPAFNAFWFAWSIFYDGSEVWNKEAVNAPGALEGNDSCLVPCNEIIQACGGGKDCIPALDYDGRERRPVAELVQADDAGAAYLADADIVLGVAIGGEARAYPHNILWWHEIYNDKVGDFEYTVSFCPLTGSGIVFAAGNDGLDFGVSGNLFNSNLIMFDRQTDTNWSQMLGRGITGDRIGDDLQRVPVVETTWKRWKEMHPETLVVSDDQGYQRDYQNYPYGGYRTNHGDTFRVTNPPPANLYQNKDRVLGLPPKTTGSTTPRAYALVEMASVGDRVVINDDWDERPIVVAYEAEHRMAIPFFAEVEGQALTFEGAQAD